MSDANAKEPLYMKWWVWMACFLITAFIVNDRSDHIDEDASAGVDLTVTYDEADLSDEKTSLTIAMEADTEDNDSRVQETDIDYQAPVTFSVGTELPAGEYYVLARTEAPGYVLLTRSRQLTRDEIIWQKHFENHTIIYLRKDEYLTTKNATLIPIDDAIVPNFEEGVLQAGTYRVGIDIPPGVYTLFPIDNKRGYFSTAATSHQLSAHTLQQRNFTEPITIALNTGDYFTMLRAEIRK